MKPFSAISFPRNDELCEYFLVARPAKEITAKIFEEKRLFDSKYELEQDKNFCPQITIANFFAKEVMEETLIRWIRNICNLQKSFVVSLNNYSGLPSSGLYLRVQNPEPFGRLANGLKILNGFMQSSDCPPLKLPSKPQVTFVAGLSQYDFDIAIKEYAEKTFHESFEVDRLILLRKDPYRKCDLISTFVLPSNANLID